MSSSFDTQRQRRLIAAADANYFHHPTASGSSYRLPNPSPTRVPLSNPNKTLLLPSSFSGVFNNDLVAAVVPPVTVVLEGRCICQRISLHKHGSYESLATALRRMFVDVIDGMDQWRSSDRGEGAVDVDLSNAIPGYVIAYEDMENDLLLAGDLNWKDFVRVAKRIRIMPAKCRSTKTL